MPGSRLLFLHRASRRVFPGRFAVHIGQPIDRDDFVCGVAIGIKALMAGCASIVCSGDLIDDRLAKCSGGIDIV